MISKIFSKLKNVDKAASKAKWREARSWDPYSQGHGGVYRSTQKSSGRTPPKVSSIPLSPADRGIGPDRGFGSPWKGMINKFSKLFTNKPIDKALSPIAKRDILAAELAPTEFLKKLAYKIRTPGSEVTIRAGESQAKFSVVGGELLPESVTTATQHRRKGLASYMYRLAEEATGMAISTKATRTALGAQFAPKRKFMDVDLTPISAMQATTRMVKNNTSNFTSPGVAQLSTRRGSRGMPQGGT